MSIRQKASPDLTFEEGTERHKESKIESLLKVCWFLIRGGVQEECGVLCKKDNVK